MRKLYKVFIIIFFALFLCNAGFCIQENPVSQEAEELPQEEDNAVYIRDIEIFGNNLIETDKILEMLDTKGGYPYNKKNIVMDLNKLYKTGYFTSKIKALPIRNEDGTINLRIIVEENSPVTGFSVEGNSVVSDGEIMKILQPIEGQPQNVNEINKAIEEIQELYSVKGFILARVSAVQDDPDGFINILLDEGIIEDVVIEGNNKTRDFVVARNVLLEPGTVYNENTTRTDILRLMGTQAFGDVTRDIERDPESGNYVVTINLEEQRTGKLSVGVGVDSSSGFFGSVGFEENNFRGLGQHLGINLMAGTGVLMSDESILRRPNYQAEISFLEPYFKDRYTALGLRAYFRSFGSYQVPLSIENKIGAEATLSRRFKTYKNLTGSIAFGVEDVHMKEGDEGKIKNLYAKHHVPWSKRHEQLQGGFFIKLTPTLTYDTRDTIINPRHGGIASVSLEEAVNIASLRNSYGKLNGAIRKFIPMGKKSSLVLTAKAGGRFHGHMPEFASYSLGGPYNIRGMNISEVGTGSGYMMGSAEVRVPVPFIDRLTSNTFINNIRIAAFVDAGKIFSPTVTDLLYERPGYAITAGVGLRVYVPGMGSVSLDYGIPLTNTGGVKRDKGFFTFGMGEML